MITLLIPSTEMTTENYYQDPKEYYVNYNYELRKAYEKYTYNLLKVDREIEEQNKFKPVSIRDTVLDSKISSILNSQCGPVIKRLETKKEDLFLEFQKTIENLNKKNHKYFNTDPLTLILEGLQNSDLHIYIKDKLYVQYESDTVYGTYTSISAGCILPKAIKKTLTYDDVKMYYRQEFCTLSETEYGYMLSIMCPEELYPNVTETVIFYKIA